MTEDNSSSDLNSPVILSCGAVLKNRIIKSAMSDSLGDGEGNPTKEQIRLYERWAEGGVALSIIGEVQVDPRFPEKPGNLVLGEHSDREKLQQLTARATVNGAHIWTQLGHAGALSYQPVSQPRGPSELTIDDFHCDGMSLGEIEELPQLYVRAAVIAREMGFTGVQIHAGHGFLLSQFLSPLFNRRQDAYGGSIAARSRIIIEIISKIRTAVGSEFPIGIKINSSDQLEGGLSQDDALEVVRMLDSTSVDLIEISGGTYFPGAKASSDGADSGPYFIEFAARAKMITDIPLVVTGGFKTRTEAVEALAGGILNMVGIARALVLNTSLANDWLSGLNGDPVFPRFSEAPEGGITAWYTMLLTALGQDAEKRVSDDIPAAISAYEERDRARCVNWLKRFSA